MQLGGGTDINAALAYCEAADRASRAKTHLVLITDLYEGGNAPEMLARAAALVASGVNVIVLLALTDNGRPGYDADHAAGVRGAGLPGLRLHARPVSGPDGGGAAARRHRRLGGGARHRAGEGGVKRRCGW